MAYPVGIRRKNSRPSGTGEIFFFLLVNTNSYFLSVIRFLSEAKEQRRGQLTQGVPRLNVLDWIRSHLKIFWLLSALIKSKSQKRKIQISCMWKYCWRGFIWMMVTPQDFVHWHKNYVYCDVWFEYLFWKAATNIIPCAKLMGKLN